MTNRYTYPNLERDCLALNSTLEHLGSDYRLVVGSSYGYSTVDLATVSQLVVHCCERRLVSGSPRECITSARQFVSGTSQASFAREAKLRQALRATEQAIDLWLSEGEAAKGELREARLALLRSASKVAAEVLTD